MVLKQGGRGKTYTGCDWNDIVVDTSMLEGSKYQVTDKHGRNRNYNDNAIEGYC